VLVAVEYAKYVLDHLNEAVEACGRMKPGQAYVFEVAGNIFLIAHYRPIFDCEDCNKCSEECVIDFVYMHKPVPPGTYVDGNYRPCPKDDWL
jgi:hypothetical protein